MVFDPVEFLRRDQVVPGGLKEMQRRVVFDRK